jgi:predicted DNA-binding transcriptional regulator AlpA
MRAPGMMSFLAQILGPSRSYTRTPKFKDTVTPISAPEKPITQKPPPEKPIVGDLMDMDLMEDDTTLPDRPMSVSIRELSDITGLSKSLLYTRANVGNLPGCRIIGSRFLIHLETFEDYLKAGTGKEQMNGENKDA